MSYQKDEIKYHMLRNELDKLKYFQTLDYSSMDLVEALLNDILSIRRSATQNENIIKEQTEKNETLVLAVAAYKHQNAELFKQNSELHTEILTMLDKQNYSGKEIEMKRLNDDTNAIKFLLNKAKETNSKLQTEIVEVKQKYIALIVDIYEKKINMQKIFEELEQTDELSIKQRSVEVYGKENDIHSSHIGNNKINSDSESSKGVRMGVSQGVGRRTNHELVEKIYELENEIKEKNKEINYLKRNKFTENVMEQKVIIDYLKNELKATKEKYECYLKYQIDKNDKILNKKIRPKKIQKVEKKEEPKTRQMTTKNDLQTKILERDLAMKDAEIESLKEQNEMLKSELNQIAEKYNSSKNFIQNEFEKEFAQFSKKNLASQNAEINLLTSLTQKLKETESNLKSSQQHYKNQMTELNKVNLKLQTEIDKLTKKNKKNDKDLGEYKTKINGLNQKIFQLQSQLNQ